MGAIQYDFNTNTTLMSFSAEKGVETWDVEFKNSTRFWVHYIMIPIIVVVGILGNLVTAYVLTRKQMYTSSNTYLTSLAISDIMFLGFSFSMSWKHYECMKEVRLYWQFGLWITNASRLTSVWLTVSFTIERYIAVCHPLMGRINCIGERTPYVSGFICITCFLLTISTSFERKTVSKLMAYSLQNTNLDKNSLHFPWFNVIFFFAIPFIILAILNICLIHAIQESRRNRETLTSSHLQNQRYQQIIRQEDRVTITLVSVIIVFLICQLPSALVLIYKSMNNPPKPGSREENILLGLDNVCSLLLTINTASNFLLYTALSNRFRRAFTIILWSKYQSSRSSRGDIPLQIIYARPNHIP